MAVTWIDPGSAATQDLIFLLSTSVLFGTVASDTQAVFGSRSYKCTTSSFGTGFANTWTPNCVLADAGSRISIALRLTQLPTTNPNAFCRGMTASAAANCWFVGFDPNGHLVIFSSAGTVVATGASVLAINTDYLIGITVTITSTSVNSLTVYLNGVLETSVSNTTMAINSSTFGFGNNALGADMHSTGSNYFAHLVIDNGSSGWIGNLRATAKRPVSNGSANGFTTQVGSGGSGYGTGRSPQVNERPLSITNGWEDASIVGSVTEEYNIEAVSVGDVDLTSATLVDYMGWMYSKCDIAANADIIVNGVATVKAQTTSAALYTRVAGSAIYPAGTGTDIGMDDASLTHNYFLYECGIVFAFTPAFAQKNRRTQSAGIGSRGR